VQGIWYNNGSRQGPAIQHLSDLNKDNILVNLSGKGHYRTPEFIWNETVAPTGLAFLNSTKMGKQYENDMFVGDFKNGNLYHFKLNTSRTGLSLHGQIADRIASSPKDIQDQILGRGFGGITDVKTAPDGSLYIVSNQSGTGTIYRISHK
jgi:glucose/arabinose dehydrogenase